jgi:maltooligosyltrehalose synthase
VSPQFGWENDLEEIVWVYHALVGNKPQDQGKRNFFYQTMNGYWDIDKKNFQFVPRCSTWIRVEGKMEKRNNRLFI